MSKRRNTTRRRTATRGQRVRARRERAAQQRAATLIRAECLERAVHHGLATAMEETQRLQRRLAVIAGEYASLQLCRQELGR